MHPNQLVTLLVLLTLVAASAPTPAHAGGIVSVCDEAHLLTALTGGGTVTFSCSGTITLTATITIAANTTIDGNGQSITISGNHAVRVFTVNSGVTLNLNRLTIADGSTTGDGGGIENGGVLDVTNTGFLGNSAASGGGIYSYGTLIVRNCAFSGNSTDYGGSGIRNYAGTVTVSNSTFSGNTTTGGGAGGGGGIRNYAGPVTVSNSTFSGNTTAGAGGGIHNYSGSVTVNNSTFSGNSATGPGGGGGIYSLGDTTVIVSNSTFDSNSAQTGGGISNLGRTVTVSNSTFSGNSAANFGGGIYNYNSGSVQTTLKNTIVANSPTGGNCSGAITDGGGNLSYPDVTCPGINADPKLRPLQDNGGPTRTMALLPSSAAIDAGIDAICTAAPVNGLDQRGVSRPQGPHCDIGAYEAFHPRAYLPMIAR